MNLLFVPNISTVEKRKVSVSYADGFWDSMAAKAAPCFISISAQESLA